MHCVSHALKRVMKHLFAVRLPSEVACSAPAPEASPRPTGATSPETWGALLATARRRRAPHLWPCPGLPAVEDDSITGALVRAYVLPEDARTRTLASPTREAR
jgi:hypothetical protein